MADKAKTKAAFRRYLNNRDLEERARKPNDDVRHVGPAGTRYRQVKRLYGDYLYHQDREKFEVEYQEWLATPDSA